MRPGRIRDCSDAVEDRSLRPHVGARGGACKRQGAGAPIYAAMRRTAYVCLLLALLAAGMALVVFWLHNWLCSDDRAPLLVVAGAWMAVTATVALGRGGRRVASAGSAVAR